MTARSVQILYHLYAVAQTGDDGIIGQVLTEYHLEKQHDLDRAEARLRAEARTGAELASAIEELHDAPMATPLLTAALDHQREQSCRRVLALFETLGYDARLVRDVSKWLRIGSEDWRARIWERLESALSPAHKDLLVPLFERKATGGAAQESESTEERFVELAMGRY